MGVVGVLQFDVLKYRLKNEYNVEILWKTCHMSIFGGLRTRMRWMCADWTGTSRYEKGDGLKGNPLLLFINSWSVGMTLDRNEGLILSEFSRN